MVGSGQSGDSYRCPSNSHAPCHPNAPAGGGGAGGFTQAGSLGSEGDGRRQLPHPDSIQGGRINASQVSRSNSAQAIPGGMATGAKSRRAIQVLRPGAKGPEVKRLRTLLNLRLEPSPGLPLEGGFDAATEKAVRDLQQAKKIRIDGVVGKDTWYYLLAGETIKLPVVSAPASAASAILPAEPAPAPAPAKPPENAVVTWPLDKKFGEVLTRTAPLLPGDLQKEFLVLISPESLAMIAGTLVLLAASHAFGVGEIIDIALLITGAFFLGRQIVDVAGDVNDFLVITCNAETNEDLDRAAHHLSRVVAVIGVAAFVALLSKIKLRKGGAGAGAAAAEEAEAAAVSRRRSSTSGAAAADESAAARKAPAATETPPSKAPASGEPAKPVGNTCSQRGCPISMVTGEEMLERVDFTWDGPLALPWRRFYRSGQCDRDLQLGHGWLTYLDEWLEVGERVSFHNADGQRIDLPLPEAGAYSVNLPEQLRLQRDAKQFRLRDPSGRERIFAGAGGHCHLVAWRNPEGQSLHFHRNGFGEIERISASGERHLLLERRDRRIVAIRRGRRNGSAYEAFGDALIRYQYSEEGDLTAARDPLDQGESYSYRNHLIQRRTLASGFHFHFEWDGETPQAKCLHNWGDNGIFDYRFEWLPDGVSKAIDSRGGIEVFKHNAAGFLLSDRTPEGRETQHVYNSDHLRIETTHPSGAVTRFGYDAEGRLISVTDPLGHVQRIRYDSRGNPTEFVDSLGQRWIRRYDERDRLQESIAANGAVTRYDYNAHGLLARVTDGLGQSRSLLWDESMLLVGETGFDGRKTRYQYDESDRIVAVIDNERRTTRYSYDALDRIVAMQQPDGGGVRLSYNANGQLTHYTDALGRVTEYRYDDGLTQPTARIDPLGHTLRYRYDSERNLIGLVNPKGESYGLKYDLDENLIEETGFDGRVQSYRYGTAGFLDAYLQGATEATAKITRFERDGLGRLVKKHSADGLVSQYGYDPLGRLQLAKNADSTLILGYNALGQVNLENQDGAMVRHKYDLLGRRIQTETPDRQRIDYRYAGFYLEGIDFNGQPLSRHCYDDLGREIGRSQGQLESSYDYDPMGRLLRQRASKSKDERSVLERSYRYDAAGKLSEIDDMRQGITRYHYDPSARLIRTEGLNPESFVHDPAGNLLGASPEGGRVEGDRLLMMGDRHYRYDDAGNLIEERRGKEGCIVTRYAYDGDNRLICAETPKGTSHYRYDALGRRLAKQTEQGETRFRHDGPRLLSERQGEESRTYVFEIGGFRPLAQIDHSGTSEARVYHYHLDHLGTPREMTDAEGKIVWSAQYRAYGNLALADVAEIDNPIRFQGQYYDAETGLHYNLNRYYDPSLGRFIHQDPIGLRGGSNIYAYVQNPSNWIDPLGLSSEDLDGFQRRTPTPGDQDHLTARAARRAAMRSQNIPTSRPYQSVLSPAGVDGSGRNMYTETITEGGRNTGGAKPIGEINVHPEGHVFKDNKTFEKPHYHGAEGEHHVFDEGEVRNTNKYKGCSL